MKTLILTLSILSLSATSCDAANVTDASQREGKLMSMFQVIKFPNDGCSASNSRNGTCYTSILGVGLCSFTPTASICTEPWSSSVEGDEGSYWPRRSECTSKSGTASGSCASGYGVCCTFVLGCGQSSSQNLTYFESSGASAGSCTAKICKLTSNICQLRLDFSSFVITGPSTLTTTTIKAMFGQVNDQGVTVSSASQCLTDSFVVSGSTSTTVPTLCGTLTGDHIYLEANPNCNSLTFNLGSTAVGASIATRSWAIKVSQYNCDFANRAPVGCLQYFFGSNTGTVKSFNFPTYHLATQRQTICIRRERGNCRICWSATATTDFQLSGKSNALVGIIKQSLCCAYKQSGKATSGFDCLVIPGASNAATPSSMLAQSYCGRSQGLVKSVAGAISTTVCSKRTPFKISFYSDNWETTAAANGEALKSAGFRLGYSQTSC